MSSILVHGGAGDLHPGDDPVPAVEGCRRAARAGHAVLVAGGSALDAVIAAVTMLEDDPTFNAGLGSVLTVDGDVEMDASVMTGDLRAGAVALVRDLKNPIQLARMVMQLTPHVLLAGPGAQAFAAEQGVPLLPAGSLVTERQRSRWQQKLTSRGHGTVGAVACDDRGHVAAATSTGGMMMKRSGRIGDSPLIGCGTYADDLAGACSCTGVGEAIIKVTLARFAVDRLRAGSSPQSVAVEALAQLQRAQGDGGLIVVDRHGQLGFAFNSQKMSRAWVDATGAEGAGFGAEVAGKAVT